MEEKPTERQKEKEEFVKHPELKGLLILAISLAVLASLISFFYTEADKNYLGLIGYYIAFGLNWLFGFGSYLIVCFSCWVGWRLLYSEKVPAFTMRAVYFGIALACLCLLFNVYSEVYGVQNPLLQSHVYSETITFKTPYYMTITRYNLGGVPLYYLYRDLPIYNLKNLLSNIGIFFTFSLTGIIAFILLTQLSLVKLFKKMKETYKGMCKFFVIVGKSFKPFPLKGEKRNIPYDEMEEALANPIRHESKPLWQEPSCADTFYASFSEDDSSEEEEEEVAYEPEPTKPPAKKSPYDLTPKPKKTRRSIKFKLPPVSLLTAAKKIDKPSLKRELRKQAEILEDTLASFGIEAKVGQINCGPTITSFELHPAIGVKVQKIKALEDDIALNLQAKSIRIIAPIPGKAAVGVEVPSLYPQEVGFKEMLSRYQQQRKNFTIPILLGKTVSGEDVMCDLTKMPHCIIAGATGSGKSVCINTIVMSILMNNKPDDVKLLLVDPKKVELSSYSELPHMIAPVITEPQGAYAALQWLVKEMQARYEVLKRLGLRNITSFNSRVINQEEEEELGMEIPERFFYVVAIIDEFADLMMASSTDLETPIARIAQMARAVGIHLVLATQRPSREVITGLIKANFPTRVAFKVSSRINSQIILDENGAETLLGNGDLLFMPPGSSQLIRAQGSFIRDEDINKIIEYHCKQDRPNYLIKSFDQLAQEEMFDEGSNSPKDTLYDNALTIVLTSRNASTTFLQRKLKIGYARAASLMDELEERGVIGPQEGSKSRKILMNSSGFEDL
ncbi:MAG: DNA translocase FtsK [Chlamydiia bacterium]|nr:DNA translocase FtsK [Chlamydiia bacterium]